MRLSDQKMTTKVVLDVTDNVYSTTAEGVKRIRYYRVKSQNPGTMTRLPTRAGRIGPATPA
jgi:hypothetical protein